LRQARGASAFGRKWEATASASKRLTITGQLQKPGRKRGRPWRRVHAHACGRASACFVFYHRFEPNAVCFSAAGRSGLRRGRARETPIRPGKRRKGRAGWLLNVNCDISPVRVAPGRAALPTCVLTRASEVGDPQAGGGRAVLSAGGMAGGRGLQLKVFCAHLNLPVSTA
jgi:hypothetical protein